MKKQTTDPEVRSIEADLKERSRRIIAGEPLHRERRAVNPERDFARIVRQ